MRPALALLAAALVLSGCTLPGESRLFPDESDQVVRLHVNAYQSNDDPRLALVEISGLGVEGQEHAFRGQVRVRLDLQVPAEPRPTYAFVEEWVLELDADDFASTAAPHHVFRVSGEAFPRDGTYRASVAGTIGEREPLPASALFSYHRPT